MKGPAAVATAGAAGAAGAAAVAATHAWQSKSASAQQAASGNMSMHAATTSLQGQH
jgi:hypothetical protein